MIVVLDCHARRIKEELTMAMVIVFGSLNIDLVMKVKHQPAVGETISTKTYDWLPGGKGCNQAVACARSGVKTAMVGQIGDDGFGTRLFNTLKKNEVLASGVARHDSEPTGMAMITVDLDYLIVNQIEGRQMAEKMGLKIEDSAVALASKLAKEAGLTCVMTLGPLGCIAIKPDGKGWKVDAYSIGDELVDTTGAGDTFCGVFAGCVFKKMSLQETLRHASVSGSLACKGHGAQSSMPYESDIEEYLEQIPKAVAV